MLLLFPFPSLQLRHLHCLCYCITTKSLKMKLRGSKSIEWKEEDYGRVARANSKNPNRRTTVRRATRSRAEKRPRLTVSNVPTRDTVPVTTPSTRSQRIRCTTYVPDRELTFPQYLFCQRCVDWETMVSCGAVGQNKRDSTST